MGVVATLPELSEWTLTPFDMGGAMMAPQNVFDHCAQMLRRRKLKFADF